MKIIKQTYHIFAPIEMVWQALINPDQIDAWSAAPVVMTDQEGEKFSLWGGDIYGKNMEVEENERLVQEWFSGDWSQPSKVTINLESDNSSTHLSLLHENIPDKDYEETDQGWKEYYFGPLKEYVENKFKKEQEILDEKDQQMTEQEE